jgi:hypothetical protein
MRDTLALALVRAELCRVQLAEQNRLQEKGSGADAPWRIGRAIRSWRRIARGLTAAEGSARSRAASDITSPAD